MSKESWSKQTPESLRAMATELERVAAEYRQAAENWELMAIESLEVKGESERARSLKGAHTFAKNAIIAMWEEMARRMKFGIPIPKEVVRRLQGDGETPPPTVSDSGESVSDKPARKRVK